MTVVKLRYTVRAYIRWEDDGPIRDPETGWCVWDNAADAEAEAHEMRYINLRYDEALEAAEELNHPE
jgi:hypothetical protein